MMLSNNMEVFFEKINNLKNEAASNATVIAILDSGIEKNKINSNIFASYDFTYTTSSGENYSDILGHGTKTAAIVAATAPESNILDVKVLNDADRRTSNILSQAIRWSVDMGARVLAMPLTILPISNQLEQAIEYAVNKGAILIASAGNEGTEIKDNSLAAQEGGNNGRICR